MKILYITLPNHLDYQNDCLLIGLKELYGENVVDVEKRSHIYDTFPVENLKFQYGFGMTVTRCLPDLEVDRTEILNKIKNKYFDLVIYGSILRCSTYLQEVLSIYPKNKIICIDGEDHNMIDPISNNELIYFKRELIYDNIENVFPISFGMPLSKINFNENKIKDYAYITPLDRNTYIYKEEKDYYNDYKEARLAITCKKSGWDCMRHYEILSNGCLPNFKNIENCPSQTMIFFPKNLCVELNKNLNIENISIVYEKYVNKFKKHFFENNTTTAIAKNVISIVKKY